MSFVDEGFICPYCLVGFLTSAKLQSHFVEIHSGGDEKSLGWKAEGDSGDVGATAGYEQLGHQEVSVDGVLGHQFVLRRMQKPSSCSACEEIIWQDGIACQSCSVVIHHDGCRGQLAIPCTTLSEVPEVRQLQRSSGPQQFPKGPLALVRRQVAKGRERYVNKEFDLDLTYITERIIAMSFPATGMESTYRNNLKDVAKMLKTKHQENYMVLDFGWPDHLAPSLERLSSVCRSMKSWLDSDPLHVVVVHCKGGKGRTGCVIAAFMNYSEICQSAEAALDRFAMKRFYDSKCIGVTQPSQRKYVYYFSDLLAGKISLQTPPVLLNHVIIHGVPNCDGKGGCRVFLKIYVNMKLEHTTSLYVGNEEDERIKITLHGGGINIQGEVLLKCFHKRSHSGMDSVFRCQFHTAIISDNLRLVLKKEDLDDAFKDKRFPDSAKVELLFESDEDVPHVAGPDDVDVDVRSSLLETNGAASSSELLKHESLSKRDSYANFEGGFDSGSPDKVPDMMQFSPTSPRQERMRSPPVAEVGTSGGRRSRTESTESFSMDPQAIERVAMPGSSEVYTVVNKSAPSVQVKQPVVTPEHLPNFQAGQSEKPAAFTDPSYVNQSSVEKPISCPRSLNKKPGNPQKPHQQQVARIPLLSFQTPPLTPNVDYDEVPEEASQQTKRMKPESKTTVNHPLGRGAANSLASSKGKVSYDEILVNQLMKLRPVTPRHSGHDSDAGCRGDSGNQSSTSSNPTLSSNGDMYSNLGDLFVEGAFVRESQRRHSFAEGDELIAIHRTGTSDSDEAGCVDYNNIGSEGLFLLGEKGQVSTVTGQEEALYTNPKKVVATLNLEVRGNNRTFGSNYYNLAMSGGAAGDKIAVPLPKPGGVVRPPSGDSEDYMNEEPQGVFHTYSNHKELLEQLQAGNNPVPEPTLQNTESVIVPGGEKKITVMLKNIISKTPFLKKTPSEIHSQTITEIDRQKTLQPFALAGNAQAGRDYEAFFKTSAWGASEKHPPMKPYLASERKPEVPKRLEVKATPDKLMMETEATEDEGHEQRPEREFKSANTTQHTKTSTQAHIPSSIASGNAPQVTHTRSVDKPTLLDCRDYRPTPLGLRPETSVSSEKSSGVGAARGKLPPPRPPPYIPPLAERCQKVSSETEVRSLMAYWYQPKITREEAIGLVQQMNSGAFIVRDSQTVSGGYALTIKVTEAIVRQRKKLGDTTKVTEDMCVTHFLIQPDPEGVKLQGWNEIAFKSLAEFIAHHTVDKLCLPCKLVLPKAGCMSEERGRGRGEEGRRRRSVRGEGEEGAHQLRRRPVTMQEALKTGAACDLVYLGSVDVPGPGSDVLLANTVQQRKSLDISVSIVTFKAAKEGITISDNVSGLYIKRQYPISSVTYCGADPNDTRWDFSQLQHLGEAISITNAPCFGVFTRLPDNGGHSCLLFAQYSLSQPVMSILSYLHQVMRQRQLQN